MKHVPRQWSGYKLGFQNIKFGVNSNLGSVRVHSKRTNPGHLWAYHMWFRWASLSVFNSESTHVVVCRTQLCLAWSRWWELKRKNDHHQTCSWWSLFCRPPRANIVDCLALTPNRGESRHRNRFACRPKRSTVQNATEILAGDFFMLCSAQVVQSVARRVVNVEVSGSIPGRTIFIESKGWVRCGGRETVTQIAKTKSVVCVLDGYKKRKNIYYRPTKRTQVHTQQQKITTYI